MIFLRLVVVDVCVAKRVVDAEIGLYYSRGKLKFRSFLIFITWRGQTQVFFSFKVVGKIAFEQLAVFS